MLPEIIGTATSSLFWSSEPTTRMRRAWRAVVEEVSRPWGEGGEYEAEVHLVDDPVWAGATFEAVVTAVKGDEYLSVVFVADEITMKSAQHALLALDPLFEDEDLDPTYYQELIDSTPAREFRTTPAAVHDVHANLSIGNIGLSTSSQRAPSPTPKASSAPRDEARRPASAGQRASEPISALSRGALVSPGSSPARLADRPGSLRPGRSARCSSAPAE